MVAPLINFFKPRRSPEKDLTELIQGLTKSLGAHLQSVVLFGSMASGEFHAEHSDVNVMVVLDDSAFVEIISMTEPLRRWTRKGHILPIIVRSNEVRNLARSLPIEFLDMLDHHRTLHGDDPLAGLSVDPRNLRAQCEHELTLHFLKMRQGLALVGKDEKKIRSLLIHSLPSVLAVFRNVLRLEEKVPKLSKIEAAALLAKRVGFDAEELRRLHESRFSRSTDNLDDLLIHYLDTIEKVVDYLHRV